MARQAFALEHAGRRGAGAHGTGVARHRAGAVAFTQTVLVPALDGAGVALALAGAHNVDAVAHGEHVGLEDIAHVHGADVVQAELTQRALGRDVRFIKVALGGFRNLLGRNIAVAQLNGHIAVALHRFLLHDRAGACFHDSDGHDFAVLVKDLGHAHLLADDTFLHFVLPPNRLLVDAVHGAPT